MIIDFRGQDRWLTESSSFHDTSEISSNPVTLGTTYREPGPFGVRNGMVTEFERPTKITFHQPMTMKLHSGAGSPLLRTADGSRPPSLRETFLNTRPADRELALGNAVSICYGNKVTTAPQATFPSTGSSQGIVASNRAGNSARRKGAMRGPVLPRRVPLARMVREEVFGGSVPAAGHVALGRGPRRSCRQALRRA